MPETPSYASWRDVLLAHWAQLDTPVLVGHSHGGAMLLKALSEMAHSPAARGLFLLAAPFWGAPDWDVADYQLGVDFPGQLRDDLPLFLYHNEDDDVVPFDHLSRYAGVLPQARLRCRASGGHLFRGDLSDLARDIQSVQHC